MTALDDMVGDNCMSRKHLWEFKNRRQQHKFLVDAGWCVKQTERHRVHATKHSKKRVHNIAWYYARERALEQQDNKWWIM